jgi:hypothetical protein
MSTSRIVFYVLGAAAAGLLVSTLATGKGSQWFDQFKQGMSDMLKKSKSSGELKTQRDQRAEYDQANNAPGIA